MPLVILLWGILSFSDNNYQKGMNHYKQAYNYSQQNKLDQALNHYLLAHEFMSATDSTSTIISIKKNLGYTFHRVYNYPMAIDYYDQALSLAESEDVKTGIMYNKAMSLREMGMYDEAMKLIQICYQNTEGDLSVRRANIINEIGLLLVDIGQFEESRTYFFSLLRNATKLTDSTKYQGRAYQNIANSFFKEGDHQSAIPYFEKAIAVKTDPFYKLFTKIDLAESYMMTADYSGAIHLIEDDLPAIKEKYHSNFQFIQAYKWVYKSYQQLGKDSLAKTYLSSYEGLVSDFYKSNHTQFQAEQRMRSLLKYQEFKRKIEDQKKVPVWFLVASTVLLAMIITYAIVRAVKARNRNNLLMIQRMVNSI